MEVKRFPGSSMGLLSVYAVHFQTKRGTRRTYVGYTGQRDVRAMWHNLQPTAWVKPAARVLGPEDLEILVPDVPSRAVARALEAFHSANYHLLEVVLYLFGPFLVGASFYILLERFKQI